MYAKFMISNFRRAQQATKIYAFASLCEMSDAVNFDGLERI